VDYEKGDPLPIWQGTERINVLLMGIDQRENEDGPWRTDTILVLTLDPVTMTGGMLSIPRDLWVPIPGYEEGRINTAHYIGEIDDYPGGGPALAVKTVQYNLGVTIHHYARVNFTAFEEIVDMIGGIDVYVEEEIDDPTYPDENYGYDPLYIPAGEQHLDGEMALKYARTRHSGGGDFDRAKRQQQVMMAIFKKVTRLDMLPQLAPKAPELWRTLQDSITTDLSLEQIIALARLASQVDPEDIQHEVINEEYTEFWTTPDKQQVLIPVREKIRELRDKIFTAELPRPEATAEAKPEATSDPTALLEEEAATIEILNGTTRGGLAGRTSEYLQEKGLDITHIGNAESTNITDTLIVAYTSKPYTASYLAQLLSLPDSAVVNGSDPASEYDISIILGSDYQPPEQ
jgi:LCP family protein required for cell wall assembly